MRWILSAVLVVLLVGCACDTGVTWRDGAITGLVLGDWGARGPSHYDAPDQYDHYARRGAFSRAARGAGGWGRGKGERR